MNRLLRRLNEPPRKRRILLRELAVDPWMRLSHIELCERSSNGIGAFPNTYRALLQGGSTVISQEISSSRGKKEVSFQITQIQVYSWQIIPEWFLLYPLFCLSASSVPYCQHLSSLHRPQHTHSMSDQLRISKTRGRYAKHACTECKRRKQRCSGDEPCRNCQSRSVICSYGSSCSATCSYHDGEYIRTLARQVESSRTLKECSNLLLTPSQQGAKPNWTTSVHAVRDPITKRDYGR